MAVEMAIKTARARKSRRLRNRNPHPCGHYGDAKRECRCTPIQMQRYRNRISGPLLDRIDIHVEVPAMEYQQLASLEKGEGSAQIRARECGRTLFNLRCLKREKSAPRRNDFAIFLREGGHRLLK